MSSNNSAVSTKLNSDYLNEKDLKERSDAYKNEPKVVIETNLVLNSPPNNIYIVSYKLDKECKEKIIETLKCKSMNIIEGHTKIDETLLNHLDYVVILINEVYLKNYKKMLQLQQILSIIDWQKVIAIFVDEKLFDPLMLTDFIKHWENMSKEYWEKNRDMENIMEVVKSRQEMKEIAQLLSRFLFDTIEKNKEYDCEDIEELLMKRLNIEVKDE